MKENSNENYKENGARLLAMVYKDVNKILNVCSNNNELKTIIIKF